MADEDFTTLEQTTADLRYFAVRAENDEPTEMEWSKAIKAAEDILKLAGAK
jgi:hypothetical protein